MTSMKEMVEASILSTKLSFKYESDEDDEGKEGRWFHNESNESTEGKDWKRHKKEQRLDTVQAALLLMAWCDGEDVLDESGPDTDKKEIAMEMTSDASVKLALEHWNAMAASDKQLSGKES